MIMPHQISLLPVALFWIAITALADATQVKVCLVPSVPGMTYKIDGSPVPISIPKNATTLGPWGSADGNRFTGFVADLLPKVLDRAGITDYNIHVYKSFGELLYRTSITGECDVGFTTFTVTASRLRCQNTTSNTGVEGCTPPDDDRNIMAKHGCCVHFGVPFMGDTIGAMVPKAVNQVTVFHALASIQVLNIISFCIVTIVIVAHLVWFFERIDNPEQFPPSYLDGIDDAIWWSCTTVTTVGYGDKYPISNGGRMIALVWMFSGVVFLGLFAGAVSSSMASQANANKGVANLQDMDKSTSKLCTPSVYYGKLYLDPLSLQHYQSSQKSVASCLEDLKKGTATGVLYDTKDLRYQFKIDPTLMAKYTIVPGPNEVMMAPAYSPSALKNPLIGNAMNSALTEIKTEKFYGDLIDDYYPHLDTRSCKWWWAWGVG